MVAVEANLVVEANAVVKANGFADVEATSVVKTDVEEAIRAGEEGVGKLEWSWM